MDDITTGSMLGRYHLMSILGKGGMGEVWLAEDPLLRRQVAIKRLLLHHMNDDEYLQRFDREARAAAALHHPHILPLHDYGQQRLPDGRVIVYIVMSYVSNGSVEDRLDSLERQGLLPSPDEAFGYLSQAAQAIDFAHQRGVLHRDIKPANMLLREDNNLLLADFGLARLTSESESNRDNLTRKSMLIGTPKYMAPEQAQGQAVAASDIYSLAVLAYRCFTGRYPFNADTVYATIVQHAIGTPTAPRLFNTELSMAFEEALLQGLAKEPTQRPSSATLFVDQLRHAMQVSSPVDNNHPQQFVSSIEGGELVVQQPSVPVIARQKAISRRVLLAGAGVLVTGSGLTAFALSPPGRTLFAPIKVSNGGQRQTSPVAKSAGNDAPVMQMQVVFSKPVVQLAWSPVSALLAAIGGDGQMVLWNIRAGQAIAPQPTSQHLFSNNSSSTNPVAFAWSPRGDMLALSNAGNFNDPPNAVFVYNRDLTTGMAAGFSKNTITSKQPISGICWAPGRYILVLEGAPANANQTTLRVYDPRQPQRTFQRTAIALNGYTGTEEKPMALSPDGLLLAIGGSTSDYRSGVLVGKLTISDTQVDWRPQSLLKTRADMGVIAWSPNGHYLAGTAFSDVKQGVLYVWDATHEYKELNPALDTTAISGKVNCMAWSSSVTRSQLAVGCSSGHIYLWDIKAGSGPVRTLPGITGSVTSLAWSHDGQWLAASYDDDADSVLIWKVGNTHG